MMPIRRWRSLPSLVTIFLAFATFAPAPAFAILPAAPYTLSFSGGSVVEGGTINVDVTMNVDLGACPNFSVSWTAQALTQPTCMTCTAEVGDFMPASPSMVVFDQANLVRTISIQTTSDIFHEGNETFELVMSNPVPDPLAPCGSNAMFPVFKHLITIFEDDPQPLFRINPPQSIPEGDSGTTMVTFDVDMFNAGAAELPVSVQWHTVLVGSADGTDIVEVSPTTLTFNSIGPQQVTVLVNGDTDIEPNETFRVSLFNSSPPVGIDGPGSVVVTINNDDAGPTPRFRISPLNLNQSEGDPPGTTPFTFTVTLYDPPPAPFNLTVQASTVVTTPNMGDYVPISPPIALSFDEFNLSRDVTVQVNPDLDFELDEQFQVHLNNSSPPAIIEGGFGIASGLIENDDNPPTPTFNIMPSSVQQLEGNAGITNFNYMVELVDPPPAPFTLTVQFRTQHDETDNADFTEILPTTLMFNESTTTLNIQIPINGDIVPESDEDFDVELLNPTAPAVLGIDLAYGTILNDDAGSTPTFNITALSSASQLEGNAGTRNFGFEVTLADPPVGTFNATVQYFTEHVDTDNADLISISPTLLAFDSSTLVQTVNVQVNGDLAFEPSEDFFVRLQNAVGFGTAIGSGKAVGTIQNDDGPGPTTPRVSILDKTVLEGDAGSPNAAIDVVVTNAIGQPMTIDWQTETGTATTTDNDYQMSGGTINFTPTTDPFTSSQILVPIVGDTNSEPSEVFRVRIHVVSPLSVTLDDVADVTILNDDLGVAYSLSISDAAIDEGNSGNANMRFFVTIDTLPSPHPPISVEYSISPLTATAGVDYVDVTGVLNFGTSITTLPINVPIIGDLLFEGVEDFVVTLQNPVGAILADPKGLGTINDDEIATMPVISIADTMANEGDAGQVNLTFTVALDQPATAPVTVSYTTEDGTATLANNDYVAASGQVTLPIGVQAATVTVMVNGDQAIEPDEEFAVELSDPVNAVFLRRRAAGKIVNDDSADDFAFAINDVAAAEGNTGPTNFTFVVTLSQASTNPLTVDFRTVDLQALAGQDYLARTGTLTFAPGSTRADLVIQVNGDTTVEPDEKFRVELLNPSSGSSITRGAGEGTIQNDDAAAPVLPVLAIDDIQVREGDSGQVSAIFSARLDRPSNLPVTVALATFDSSATTADNDYVARSGQVTIPAGEQSAKFEVLINGDTRFEGDEIFTVQVSNPQNAVLGRAVGRGLIQNDDAAAPPPSVVRLDRIAGVIENGGRAVITLLRVGNNPFPAQATIIARPGSATANADFTPIRQQVSWRGGQEGGVDIEVPILDDSRLEESETVEIEIVEVEGGATRGEPSAGILTITDDDLPMKIEFVGDANLNGKINDELDLKVKVSRMDGLPVEGAPVVFRVESGPARLTEGEPVVLTGQDGTATRRVRLIPPPGLAKVTALLRIGDKSVEFNIRVAGNLPTGGGNRPPGENDAGGTLNDACAEATGELAEACAYLFDLGNDDEQRRALNELTPQGLVGQSRAALQAPKNQVRNVGARLESLRGGLVRQSLDQLALTFQGQSLSVGPMQKAIASYRDDRDVVADKIELALRRARGESLRQVAQAVDPLDEEESPWGFFMNGRISFGDAPGRGEDLSYDFESQGLTAGVDYRISSRFIVGAAAGYLQSETELENQGGGLDLTGYSLTLYATYYLDNFYIEGVVNSGSNDYEITRVLELPRPFRGSNRLLARGEPGGDQLSFDVGVGYDFDLEGALGLSGFLRGSQAETTIDSFRESGAGPFSLVFQEQKIKSLLAEAGLEVTYPFSMSWGVLQPLVRVSYLKEFEDEPQILRAAFLADGIRRIFVIRSEQPDSNYFNLAAGISATLPRGWATFLQYDTDLDREEINVYTLTGGLRFQF